MSVAAGPGTVTPAQPAAGLINTAPGLATTTPGTSPSTAQAPGAPVTGYNPATATAATAPSTNYNPNAFSVTPNQTVAGQIQNIIASGSPLMTQAQTNAMNTMNERGLINSSQAITAGQNAVLSAAEPIAAADAGTYATAATNTTQAQNAAAAANAAAANQAQLQTAAGQTSTSQFNTGQTNAALSSEAAASNTVANTAAQSASALAVQEAQNQGNLANIMANGTINEEITNLTDQNKTLLQTSSGAAQIYAQALTNLSAITQNADMSEAQKTEALNDGVAQLNDALNALNTIAQATGTGPQSTLVFGTGGATTGSTAAATPAASTAAATPTTWTNPTNGAEYEQQADGTWTDMGGNPVPANALPGLQALGMPSNPGVPAAS